MFTNIGMKMDERGADQEEKRKGGRIRRSGKRERKKMVIKRIGGRGSQGPH